jgi:hypothetical protein
MPEPKNKLVVRDLSYFDKELEEIKSVVNTAAWDLIKKKQDYYNLAHEAEWHIEGLLYHFRNMLGFYQTISGQIAERALAIDKVGVLVFHSPEMQSLLFEFYSIVILSRLTLDHVTQYTVAPLFKPGILPGSTNTFMKGTSDLPLHLSLSTEPLVRYLFDVRDCMVHSRTFATSKNTIAISDNIDEAQLPDMKELWKYPIARTYFRVVGKNKISANILLPDAIYQYDDNGSRVRLIKDFAYSDRNNILRQSIDFIQICAASVVNSFSLLEEKELKTYTWAKKAPN